MLNRNLRFLVFDSVRLVDDQVAPVEALEDSLLAKHHLVGGDENLPVARQDHLAHELRARLLLADEAHCAQCGHPALDFVHPVGERRFGRNDQMRAVHAAIVLQVAQQGDRLQRLPYTQRETSDSLDQNMRKGIALQKILILSSKYSIVLSEPRPISSARIPLMPFS